MNLNIGRAHSVNGWYCKMLKTKPHPSNRMTFAQGLIRLVCMVEIIIIILDMSFETSATKSILHLLLACSWILLIHIQYVFRFHSLGQLKFQHLLSVCWISWNSWIFSLFSLPFGIHTHTFIITRFKWFGCSVNIYHFRWCDAPNGHLLYDFKNHNKRRNFFFLSLYCNISQTNVSQCAYFCV